MTADGTYLSGKFARQSNGIAREALTAGLASWKTIAGQRGYQPRPIPTDKLELYGGEPLQKGGIKLEVAYRDLPRGDVQRPGDSRFPNPYNLGWYDLTPAEAKSFLTNSREKKPIPDQVFQKLAQQRLKDAVRGQAGDWKPGEIKSGSLQSQLVSQSGSKQTYRLSGSATMLAGDRSFSPKFHGRTTFDSATGEFTDFRLIAAGQRTGKSGANGRESDLGPAPIAIALDLYKP